MATNPGGFHRGLFSRRGKTRWMIGTSPATGPRRKLQLRPHLTLRRPPPTPSSIAVQPRLSLLCCALQSGLRSVACGSQVVSRPPSNSHSGLEFHLAAYVPGFRHSPRRHGRITHQSEDVTKGLAKTCRAILHCRTGHRGLRSTAEEHGGSELPTGGSASLFKVKHCGI